MIVRVAAFALLLAACSRPFAEAPESHGLGTAWGETRESRVHTVRFEREDPDRPAALATIHYDDRAGLRATGAFSTEPGVACWDEGGLSVRVLDDAGEPWPVFWQGPARYVQGRSGARYTLEIANRSGARVEVVATVDGLDVMVGRRGSFARRGYLVDDDSVLRIDGFRQSEDTVAAFRFSSVEASYAARMGDDSNVGVIGVAFFPERDGGFRSWSRPPTRPTRSAAASSPGWSGW